MPSKRLVTEPFSKTSRIVWASSGAMERTVRFSKRFSAGIGRVSVAMTSLAPQDARRSAAGSENTPWVVAMMTSPAPASLRTRTAPAMVPDPAVVTLRAISQADPSKWDTSQIAIQIQITPNTTNLRLPSGGEYDFDVLVEGTTNTTVTWYVNGVEGGNEAVGTITSDGLYCAPSDIRRIMTVLVTAVSQEDDSVIAEVWVTISPQLEIYILNGFGTVNRLE